MLLNDVATIAARLSSSNEVRVFEEKEREREVEKLFGNGRIDVLE